MTFAASLNVRVEHLGDAFGIGTDRPRLSWIVETDSQGWHQGGYEIEAYDADGKLVNQTGRVESDQSVLVAWPFAPLQSREMEVNPNCVYPVPMRDIGKAFLSIRAHADEWLVDMDQIAICGFSVGAHNCAMYAVYWHDPVIHEFLGQEPAAFKPAAAILCYGIGDFH